MFSVYMHHNTIDELKSQGESGEKLKGFEFDTIKEALSFDYPFHRDNYIISQEDRNSPPDEYGVYERLADAYLWELDGSETNLENFIEY